MIYVLLFSTIVLLARLTSGPVRREPVINESTLEQACAEATKKYGLTPRESEILLYLIKGNDRNAIAQALTVSTETIKSHTRHIYGKLGSHTRMELYNAVIRCLDTND